MTEAKGKKVKVPFLAIHGDFYLSADSRQFILREIRRKEVNGEPTGHKDTFYPNLASLIREMMEIEVRKEVVGQFVTLDRIIDRVEGVAKSAEFQLTSYLDAPKRGEA